MENVMTGEYRGRVLNLVLTTTFIGTDGRYRKITLNSGKATLESYKIPSFNGIISKNEISFTAKFKESVESLDGRGYRFYINNLKITKEEV